VRIRLTRRRVRVRLPGTERLLRVLTRRLLRVPRRLPRVVRGRPVRLPRAERLVRLSRSERIHRLLWVSARLLARVIPRLRIDRVLRARWLLTRVVSRRLMGLLVPARRRSVVRLRVGERRRVLRDRLRRVRVTPPLQEVAPTPVLIACVRLP
jgi:hypothetical protein